MNINMISVKQLRENFGRVKEYLDEGKSFILLYRSQPLAEVKPFKNKARKKKVSVGENLKKVRKIAGGLRSGKNLTPQKLNELFDKSYEDVLPRR